MSALGPIVSVVLPTRNRAERVGHAVESALGQTLRELEVIVVDDASTDDTARVLAEYAVKDGRVRVLGRESAGGAAAARNLGIAHARGRYVAFLDDDSLWLPGKLERQVALLEREGSQRGVAYCPFIYHDEHGREHVIGSVAAEGDARGALLRSNFIDTSCVLTRRDLLARVNGFDEELPRLQDWDLWLRLAAVTDFGFLPEPFVHCYFTPGSISTRSDALATACRIMMSKLEQCAGTDRAELADWCYALGHVLMIGGAPAQGRSTLWRSLRLRPWPPRRLLMGGLAALGEWPYGAVSALHATALGRLGRSAGGS